MITKRKPIRISDHFSTRDFMCKCNNCDGEIKISLGLIGGLELLRFNTKKRIEILKGYICPEIQASINKLQKNYHAMGLAADITIEGLTPQEVFKYAEEIPEFKGLGLNLTEKYVHIDVRKEKKSWIVSCGETIELTPENRAQYLEASL